MSDRIDNTTGFLDAGWVHPPTPGTPSHRLIDADVALLSSQQQADALAWAMGKIEGADR